MLYLKKSYQKHDVNDPSVTVIFPIPPRSKYIGIF